MSWFSNLFKSRAQRESERLKKEADLERLKDFGKNVGSQVISIIDDFYERRATFVAVNVMNVYRERMADTHKTNESDIMEEYQIFLEQIERYKSQMFEEAETALGEWKYTLIEFGLKDSSHLYIRKRADQMAEMMDKSAREEMLYAFARVRGIISDEEHAMSPDEFKAHMERKKRENPDLKPFEF